MATPSIGGLIANPTARLLLVLLWHSHSGPCLAAAAAAVVASVCGVFRRPDIADAPTDTGE